MSEETKTDQPTQENQQVPLPLLIMQLITMTITAAPKAIELAEELRRMIQEYTKAGLINIETQEALHKFMDGVKAMVDVGFVPPHWRVRPDPA